MVFNASIFNRQTVALNPRFKYNPFFFFLSTLLIDHTETYLIFTQLSALSQLNEPEPLNFDTQYNLFVTDRRNHRVQRFDLQLTQTLLFQPRFQCNPFVCFDELS